MTKNENGTVSYSSENNIGTIEFYHPKGNSLPGSVLRQLAATIIKAGEEDQNHVLVIRSGGDGAFCAGASFDELTAISSMNEGKSFFMGFANVINAMRTCPKMIICRVHGKTVGGGLGILAASDYVIALKGSSVKLSELSLGIGPFVVGPSVRRKMGDSAFSTIALDAKTWYSSEWALSKGLFNNVAESIAELDTSVKKLASELASSNPEALAHMKEIFWQGTGHWSATLEQRAEISGKLVLSKFTKQYIDNFKNSR
jgi:methylglutaconyl-CoA hydratase